MVNEKKLFLVGDNPFHGISHLSQERARTRGDELLTPAEKAADIILTSIENGADGFMFSVSDLTLSALKIISEKDATKPIRLYAIVPYAFEYVRVATQTGTPGLVKRFTKQIAASGDFGAILGGLSAVIKMDPKNLLETYLKYELSRVKSAVGNKSNLDSVILHEVITDMSLGLEFDWLFQSFAEFLIKQRIKPGFNTRNFPLLVKKLDEWGIDVNDTVIATPFNGIGFQMNPSKDECESTLASISTPVVLAISVLAAGYFNPATAMDYLNALKNLKGIVAGISTREQAINTFTIFSKLK